MKIFKKEKVLKQFIPWLVLIFACIFILSLALPTIIKNVDDPNMIVYFNIDEGGQMDIVWWYYSGEKRPSFQWDFDYGLTMLYLADFSRLFLSNFIHFTPGLFVLILRWIYLLAWILSFFAIWRLVNHHFAGGYWQPALIVILLLVRPAFAYLCNNLKPEPLVLLFMVVGLDYTLRIIDNPLKRRDLFIAIFYAAVAFLVKYAGLFLLPTIITAIFLAKRLEKRNHNRIIFPPIKISWIFPSLIGFTMIVFPLIFIFFYVRKSTGFTWYYQYGLWESLAQNKFMLYICLSGIFLIFLSPIILLLNKIREKFIINILFLINEINSLSITVFTIFGIYILILGLRWIINPMHFINIYAQFGPVVSHTEAFAATNYGDLFGHMFQNFMVRIAAFDPIILLLFIFYLIVGICQRNKNFRQDQLQLYKSFVLLIFLSEGLLFIFSPFRIEQHHMLPFFVTASVLVLQGSYMFNKNYSGNKILRTLVNISLGLLLIINISVNALHTIKSRVHQFRQKEDVAYQIREWWHKNIPADTKVLADHYIRVYIPSSHKEIKTLDWNEKDRALRLHQLIKEYRPKLVYYNLGEDTSREEHMLPLGQIIPEKKVELIKSFQNTPEKYQCKPGAKFVIYKIIIE